MEKIKIRKEILIFLLIVILLIACIIVDFRWSESLKTSSEVNKKKSELIDLKNMI